MFLRFFFFIAITLIILQNHVQAQGELYECYSWGDPHVQTWHPKGDGQVLNQNCYTKGHYTLVQNKFVSFKVKVTSLLQIEVDLYFYDGNTPVPKCPINIVGFTAYYEDDRCLPLGITITPNKIGDTFIVTIRYPVANFLTTITQYTACTTNCHFNIYLWQPKSLVQTSKGLCTLGQNDCTRRSSDDDLPTNTQKSSITRKQAENVCNKYVNTFMDKSRFASHERSANMRFTITNVLDGCIDDLMLTGDLEMARSGLDVLMMEELTYNKTSINDIQTAIQSHMEEAVAAVEETVEEAEEEVAQILGLTTTPTTPTTTTTTLVPRAPFKCSVYQNMYIETWHSTNQTTPPSRVCPEASTIFELVRNKYVRFTLRTSSSTIDELTLRLFGETSNVVCTVTVTDNGAQWMDCEENGISPSLIPTATYEQLTVYYAKANFTTMITRDTGVNAGRFNINIYQNLELAAQSTGICNILSSCAGTGYAQSKNRFRRMIN